MGRARYGPLVQAPLHPRFASDPTVHAKRVVNTLFSALLAFGAAVISRASQDVPASCSGIEVPGSSGCSPASCIRHERQLLPTLSGVPGFGTPTENQGWAPGRI